MLVATHVHMPAYVSFPSLPTIAPTITLITFHHVASAPAVATLVIIVVRTYTLVITATSYGSFQLHVFCPLFLLLSFTF